MCDFKADPKWCLRHGVVTVTTTNFCPANNNGGWCDPPRHHFDMSMPAFLRIAKQGNEGIVPVLYRRVACKRRGGVHFTLRGQSNFNLIMISNVGGSGDVEAAWVRGSGTRSWVPMHRNWGANWQSNVDLRSQTLSFKLTLVDGKTLEFFNVVPSTWRMTVIELNELIDTKFKVSEWMSGKVGNTFSPGDRAVQLDLIGRVRGLESAESYFQNLGPS
ncbi:hypothetical protein GH714_009660 [Hevea brasiliensis]|uniref:Expansin n=1 Tax=Hevea brasiliensis TaxID=3981 RepID=A0A6A6KAZ8_HEVBR|nr:hypothetical protein GH714_009660 [Hevea brasiliensis]